MNEENTKKLFKKYPKLFPKKDRKDMKGSLMCFGFECKDGWFNLINNLCECIQHYINNNPKHSKQVIVAQVKQKFGGLRFYTNGSNELIRGMIWFAESLSYNICEECGQEGKIRKDDFGWLTTLCDKHYKERLETLRKKGLTKIIKKENDKNGDREKSQ